jgi:ribonuclease E
VPDDDLFSVDAAVAAEEPEETVPAAASGDGDADESATGRRRRRRNTRTRSRTTAAADAGDGVDADGTADDAGEDDAEGASGDGDGEAGSSGRRRRRKRRRGALDGDALSPDDPPDTVVHVREPHNPADDVRAIKGSTRLEAKKQRRREGRESGRRRPPVITESEFLARRESVERTMVVRQRGDRTQMAVLEDGVLVEHYVNRTTHASYVGNVYLGKVQNVLPSMEAAFVDIGKGRNAVLYAGEVNFDASGLEGQPKRIEAALKPGQSVIVQVTKDPVGHKGARLTSQVSLPGRYLVYVPGASMTGISRKLPDTERTRLKQILKKVTPEHAGVIVRTAAEGAAEAELDRDITRLAAQWESIEKKAKTATAPALLYGEPDLTVRVIRDVFNEDFARLIVSGDEGWEIIDEYVRYVAPHLAERISRWGSEDDEDGGADVFAEYRIDEQLAKAMERKVWLPSGGSLVIDRTEAMTVIDVNTGKFTGQGGNLEETVTRNNLEAAEEIVRQLRLRDVGGIIVIDFIDMVLESNRDLVLRRLLECLARDRTKHQVAEVTSLGLVQMTRKRVGAGLLEAFSQQCECCNGRGVIVSLDGQAEPTHRASAGAAHRPVPTAPGNGTANGNGRGQGNGSGNGKGGYGNGRRGDRRGDDRPAADAADSAQDSVTLPPAPDSTRTAAEIPLATVGSEGSAPAKDNGGRRTRRSTSAAGTAFATAVLVDDAPAPAPVVAAPAPVSEPAASEVPAGQAVTAEAAAAAPARRTRTRAGSATARVTVTADPVTETPAEPVLEAPEPVFWAAEPVLEAPAESGPETVAESTLEAAVEPAFETPAEPVLEAPAEPEQETVGASVPDTERSDDADAEPGVAPVPDAERVADVASAEPEFSSAQEPAAAGAGELAVVPASVFGAPAGPEADQPTEGQPADGQPADGQPAAGDPGQASPGSEGSAD